MKYDFFSGEKPCGLQYAGGLEKNVEHNELHFAFSAVVIDEWKEIGGVRFHICRFVRPKFEKAIKQTRMWPEPSETAKKFLKIFFSKSVDKEKYL